MDWEPEDDLAERLAEAQANAQVLAARLAEAEVALAQAREREDRELLAAGRVQASLMPRAFAGVPDGWRVAARYRPARLVGGDMYDVYPSAPARQGRLGLAIADVTGKGATAALLMAFARAVMRTAAWNGAGPADALARTNRVLARDVRSFLFITALVAELDPDRGDIRWSSAGHEPPLLVGVDGSLTELEAGGVMLGLFDEPVFAEHHRSLAVGETLLLLTDGVTDATSPRGIRFGMTRLRRAIAGQRGEGPDALLDGILAAVDELAAGSPAADDLALVAVRRDA